LEAGPFWSKAVGVVTPVRLKQRTDATKADSKDGIIRKVRVFHVPVHRMDRVHLLRSVSDKWKMTECA
jgi:hypothetical protein